MFGIILYDQIERYMRRQREIANQRANIIILQMRLHFICNAMMGITNFARKILKKLSK